MRTAGGVLLEAGGVEDHVHLLAGLRPIHRVSDVLRDIKRATSEWVHDVIGIKSFGWQEGYGAFTVAGQPADLVHYIRTQEEHHRVKTFQEDYRELLKDDAIEFDERYLW